MSRETDPAAVGLGRGLWEATSGAQRCLVLGVGVRHHLQRHRHRCDLLGWSMVTSRVNIIKPRPSSCFSQDKT